MDVRGVLLDELQRMEESGQRFDPSVWAFARRGDLRVFAGMAVSDVVVALLNSPLALREVLERPLHQNADARQYDE